MNMPEIALKKHQSRIKKFKKKKRLFKKTPLFSITLSIFL